MASTIDFAAYSDALVVLGTAGVVVPLVKRFGLNPVLGYLGAGALLGPFGLATLRDVVPALHWVTINDVKNVAGIADLGVVFLLFLIGLELSWERLVAMRRLVLGLGGLQVVVSAIVIGGLLGLAGQPAAAALVLGACLALSSTAIVLDVLSHQGRLSSRAGRASFSVLLAQDIAVVPVLMLVSVLSASAGSSVFSSVVAAMGQAVVALGIIVVVGRLLLRPFFRLVVSSQSSELFIAAILFVIVGTGVIAAAAGISMALGAFVAGLLLAETEYRRSVEATVEPFKGLLLGIFFFTVGMGLDVRVVASAPFLVVGCVLGLIAIKAVILVGLARLFRLAWPVAIETALLLGPGGEFAFVGIGLATATGLVAPDVAALSLAVTSITMALIPVLAGVARRVVAQLAPRRTDPELEARPVPRSKHAIVVGYGRVGRVVSGLLKEHGIAHTIMDSDAHTVAEQRRKGVDVYYGSATDLAFMKACGVTDASAVIVTIHTRTTIDKIVASVRELRPDVAIVSRARDAEHARHLYEIGVTDAVPETIEASLQLSEAALVGLGVPTGPVIASIHEHREVVRRDLQRAARLAGVEGKNGVQAKS